MRATHRSVQPPRAHQATFSRSKPYLQYKGRGLPFADYPAHPQPQPHLADMSAAHAFYPPLAHQGVVARQPAFYQYPETWTADPPLAHQGVIARNPSHFYHAVATQSQFPPLTYQRRSNQPAQASTSRQLGVVNPASPCRRKAPPPAAARTDYPTNVKGAAAPTAHWPTASQTFRYSEANVQAAMHDVYDPLPGTLIKPKRVYQRKPRTTSDKATTSKPKSRSKANTLAMEQLPSRTQTNTVATADSFYRAQAEVMAARHTSFQPQTNELQSTEAVYQPQANILATLQTNFQPQTNEFSTMEAIYEPQADILATRQTKFQPQTNEFRTMEAIYQPRLDTMATRQTRFHYGSNETGTEQAAYQQRADVLTARRIADTHTNLHFTRQSVHHLQGDAAGNVNAVRHETVVSEQTIYQSRTDTATPILHQVLSSSQKRHEIFYSPEGNEPMPKQIPREQDDASVQIKASSQSRRKSGTPKKAVQQTKKRKLSVSESDCPETSQAMHELKPPGRTAKKSSSALPLRLEPQITTTPEWPSTTTARAESVADLSASLTREPQWMLPSSSQPEPREKRAGRAPPPDSVLRATPCQVNTYRTRSPHK